MPILEDDVKKAMEVWLDAQGYSDVMARFGTRQGYDVEGIQRSSGGGWSSNARAKPLQEINTADLGPMWLPQSLPHSTRLKVLATPMMLQLLFQIPKNIEAE